MFSKLTTSEPPTFKPRPHGLSFGRDTQGSVGMMFALLLVPAMGLLSCAVDYSRMVTARTALLSAADNANFAGLGTQTEGFKAAQNMSESGDVTLAETDVLKFFDNEVTTIKGLSSITRTAVVTVDASTGTLTSTMTFNAKIATSFAAIMGVPALTIASSTTATSGRPVFMDFYLLLDASPSMAVAATTQAMADLSALTGCAFACHIIGSTTDSYARAHQHNIPLRIDVVKQSTQQLFAKAAATRVNPQQFGMSINTFSEVLTNVSGITQDMDLAQASANNIQVRAVVPQGQSEGIYNDDYTDFRPAFNGMYNIIPSSGTGKSVSDRQQVLFLVSDGAADYVLNGNRKMEAIDTRLCDHIKTKGIQIAVLYTTYLPILNDPWSVSNFNPILHNIGPAMKTCASPGFYFEVAPDQSIGDAMTTLFQKVVGNARLTQ